MSRITKAVTALESALKTSPALDDLCMYDLMPDNVIGLLGDDAREALADAKIREALQLLKQAAADRFRPAHEKTRGYRRGDAANPAEDFALMLIEEMVYGTDEAGRRWLGRPVYVCAARLTEIVSGRGMPPERLRKAWQRSTRRRTK